MSNLKTSHEIEEGGMIDVPKSSRNFKTGAWRTFKPVIDESKCIHCAQCVINCPESCIDITKDKKRGVVNMDYCKGCAVCSKVCPVKCIKMVTDTKEDNK